MKKFIIIIYLLFLPFTISAAYNTVQFTEDTNIYLEESGLTLQVISGSKVAEVTVGSTSVTFDMESGSFVTVRCSAKRVLSNNLGVQTSCLDTYSQVTLTSNTTKSFTITPSSIVCGGGGGGGAQPVEEEEEETAVEQEVEEEVVEEEITQPEVAFEKPISEMTVAEIRAKITEIMTAISQLEQLLYDTKEAERIYTGIPSDFIFDKNLKYGQTSNEVKYLQIILKQEVGPPIYPEDVPATGWFGPITKSSVIEFQEKYASDILAPWGLTKGTGFVGTTTRAMLNEMLSR